MGRICLRRGFGLGLTLVRLVYEFNAWVSVEEAPDARAALRVFSRRLLEQGGVVPAEAGEQELPLEYWRELARFGLRRR